MKSRAARLSLLVLFVVALGVTASLFWMSESAERSQASAREAFEAQARTAAREVVDLRGAQQAYVATGQDLSFWTSRVGSQLSALGPRLTMLRESAYSTDARAALDEAAGALQDFSEMDGRARDLLRRGDAERAADLIFSSGGELSDKAVAALDRAADADALARTTEAGTFARRRLFALAAAGAAATLVLLLLYPAGTETIAIRTRLPEPKPAPVRPQAPAPLAGDVEGWSSARRAPAAPPPAPEPVQAEAPLSEPAPATPGPEPGAAAPEYVPTPAPFVPAFNFGAVASLCTDLSRIDDTMALPPLLERAASVLDAVGIILWIADPDGRELNPVLAQGYPQHLVTRLGTIPRHAENATAAAFRTSLLQTVLADEVSNGAIAAPLVTCGGCVGVMAAEVRGEGAAETHKLASAAIIAAQLASLVGPPAGRSDMRAEAAGA